MENYFDGEKLKSLRLENGWSLREAAARLVLAGDNRATFQKWENWELGRNNPSFRAVVVLAGMFGRKSEDFLREV